MTARCPSCGETKPPTAFGPNRSLKDELSLYCLVCDREWNSAWYREYRRRLGKEVRAYFYRTCETTKRQVADIRAAQRDRCAIGGDSDPQHLDHDHDSGRTRQLLCQRCNHGLVLFHDDPDLLRSAAFSVAGHRSAQLLEKPAQTLVISPDDPPPVGSQPDPERTRSDRVTGRTSGSRRRQPAGEVDG